MSSEESGRPHGRGPPTYDEVTDPNAPPPTYDSLFGRLRHVDSPSSFAQTLYNAWVSCCGSVFVLVGLAFTTALPFAMLAIGIMYKDNCYKESFIPIYLMVGGAVSVQSNVLSIAFKLHQKRRGDEKPTGTPAGLDCLLSTFQFAWFIAGTVWVYRIAMPDMEQPFVVSNGTEPFSAEMVKNPEYCDKTLFIFAFVVVTLGWALLALVAFLGCSLCCCMCCFIIISGGETVERRSWDDSATEQGLSQEKEQYRREVEERREPSSGFLQEVNTSEEDNSNQAPDLNQASDTNQPSGVVSNQSNDTESP